jgi:hypothetical protein
MTLCVVLGPDHRLIHGFIYLSVAILIAVVVYSLKLYRIEHLSRTLENRPHFKFLTGFQSFMFMRIGRAASPSELVSLLESGVRDLDFDSVEVHGRDHCISSWSKTAKAHPDGMRNTHERVLDDIGLKVRYVIPVHDSPTYQKCLETTWFRILTQWAHRYEGLTASPLPPGAILGGPITRNRTAGP